MTTKKRKSILLIKNVASDSENEQNSDSGNENETEDLEMNEEAEDETELVEQKPEKKVKKKKPGIIYLSSIPQHMTVAIVRDFLNEYGEVGRIFLQPDKKFRK